MFCIMSLVESWKALVSTSDKARPTALDATKEIFTKYENVLPMSKSGYPIEQPVDVIEAEKRFGISFFTGFSHILIREGRYYVVLEARFQGHPHKPNLVSCPQIIRAHGLSKEYRRALQDKLEGIKGLIPKPVWGKLEKRYEIVKKEWLVILEDEEET